MDIQERISDLSNIELEQLLRGLNYILAGATIGIGDAFAIISEIEGLAITEKHDREQE